MPTANVFYSEEVRPARWKIISCAEGIHVITVFGNDGGGFIEVTPCDDSCKEGPVLQEDPYDESTMMVWRGMLGKGPIAVPSRM